MRVLIVWISLLFLLCSCMQSQQLEKLGVVLARGIDKNENDEIELSVAILQFHKNSPSITKTISGTGKTLKGARENANKKANQELVIGKLNLEIYSKEIAEGGVELYLDTLRRDANIPSTIFLAVSETNAKDIFNVQEETINTNLGQFLHGIIQPGVEKRLFPEIPLPKFVYAIKNPGLEPVLPIMGIRDGIPSLTGLAVFKEDKMVGQLSLDDAQLYQLIEGTIRGELWEIALPLKPLSPYLTDKQAPEKHKDIHLTFIIEKGRATTHLTNKKNLQFTTDVNLELNLQEISHSYKLDEKKAIHHLEREIEKHVKRHFERVLAELKELNSDAFGYGVLYRIQNKNGKLNTEEWDELFPNIDVDFNVKAKVIRHGEVHR